MALGMTGATVPTVGRALWIVVLVTAAILALNGIWMIVDPPSWYAGVPGVTDTGELNGHFVRDIGAAYLAAALALALAVTRRTGGRPLAMVALVFLGIHALEHIADVIAGRLGIMHLLGDFPAVGVPALVALWAMLALPRD